VGRAADDLDLTIDHKPSKASSHCGYQHVLNVYELIAYCHGDEIKYLLPG
jgi:hypothetical protein